MTTHTPEPQGRTERMREKRIAQHTSRCRHFTGIQNDACELGIVYATLKDESVRPFRWPCVDADAATTCPSCSRVTREEAEAEIRESDSSITRVLVARSAIVGVTGGKRGVAGEMACPNCKAGRLHYSVAGYNGHIHGSCSTEGCCSWME